MKTFAVVQNNKVTNIIVGVEDDAVAAYPDYFVEYSDTKPLPDYIDGGIFFPKAIVEPVLVDPVLPHQLIKGEPTV